MSLDQKIEQLTAELEVMKELVLVTEEINDLVHSGRIVEVGEACERHADLATKLAKIRSGMTS